MSETTTATATTPFGETGHELIIIDGVPPFYLKDINKVLADLQDSLNYIDTGLEGLAIQRKIRDVRKHKKL